MLRTNRDGFLFWEFPDLPFDVGKRTHAILNFYLRTRPDTGKIVTDQWAIYPNNSSARTLGPLLDFLTEVSDLNSSKLANMTGHAVNMIKSDHREWLQRLAFYRAKRDELFSIDPDQPVGNDTAVGQELSRYLVEPLLLGWYPNDTPPFSQQGGVYSQQTVQSVMDIYTPMTVANQIAVAGQAQAEAWKGFKADLAANTVQVFTETIPGLIKPLSLLPLVLVGAVGFGVYSYIANK